MQRQSRHRLVSDGSRTTPERVPERVVLIAVLVVLLISLVALILSACLDSVLPVLIVAAAVAVVLCWWLCLCPPYLAKRLLQWALRRLRRRVDDKRLLSMVTSDKKGRGGAAKPAAAGPLTETAAAAAAAKGGPPSTQSKLQGLVADYLKGKKKVEKELEQFLKDPASKTASQYAKVLREASRRRRVLHSVLLTGRRPGEALCSRRGCLRLQVLQRWCVVTSCCISCRAGRQPES